MSGRRLAKIIGLGSAVTAAAFLVAQVLAMSFNYMGWPFTVEVHQPARNQFGTLPLRQ